MKRTIVEFLVITLAGVMFGLTANHYSNKQLRLQINHDYFPTAKPVRPKGDAASQPATQPVPIMDSPTTAPNGGGKLPNPPVANDGHMDQVLKELGLKAMPHDQVVALFHDPLFKSQLAIFVDARNDEHYREGHIPNAMQYDRYHPEAYEAEVLAACQQAQQIVVYCGGGECEDSKFTALELLKKGIHPDYVWVYTGGITEWKKQKQPVEKGLRGSGDISPGGAP